MRKVILSIILLILLTFTSCFNGENGMGVFWSNDEKIADNTFSEIITAIKLEDGLKLSNMFSAASKSKGYLSESTLALFDYIQGDIVSFSSASEAGVGADYRAESGKRIKDIQSSFSITTTEKTYYIAIKECIMDELDEDNIGIMSMYIIESTNWTENCVYRGDGKWIPGINIVD